MDCLLKRVIYHLTQNSVPIFVVQVQSYKLQLDLHDYNYTYKNKIPRL